MKFNITITWSKIMALLVLVCSFYLDIHFGKVTVFLAALPTVALMIGIKQVYDAKKENCDE